MATLEPVGPNAEQIQYWNELAGQKWVAFQPLLDAQLSPLGRRTMERAGVASGERVLDVGCGCGNSTLDLARRVGSAGAVTGIDISTVMLERARQAAGEAGVTQARFENADAQTHRFPPSSFDVLFSRFGVMFFTDPAAAFANLRQALRPGGRVGFVCWQGLQHNPWMRVPLSAALPHIPPPPLPAPDAPGPFAFADVDRVRAILTRAGFTVLNIEALNESLSVGGGRDLDDTASFLVHIGPLGRLLRDAEDDVRARVAESVRDAIAPFATPQGVRMPSAAWVVTAQRPSD
ncbi:MAG: class I SAM-dependent methyltransferase [Candidatus Binatia bacterium]